MNPNTQATGHVQPARGIRVMRIGAVALLAISLMSFVLAAQAWPLTPDAPDGVIVPACPDGYENDNVRETASTLVKGTPQLHSFDGNTNLGVADKDWAKFEVVRLGVYTLTTSDLISTDTVIELYDAGNNLVAANDNLGAGPGSQIVWAAPVTASGWYYALVYPTGASALTYANCGGTMVSYTLSLDSRFSQIFLPLVMRNYP